MVLADTLESGDEQNRRGEPRNEVRLSAACDLGGTVPPVMIRDLSQTGMLLETGAELPCGDVLTVKLFDELETAGKVVWRSGPFYGFEFEQALPRPVVSAARLRSPWQPESAPSDESAIDVEAPAVTTARDLFNAEGRNPLRGYRRYILFGMGLLAWAPVLAAARWLF